jgi:hypothetical protein
MISFLIFFNLSVNSKVSVLELWISIVLLSLDTSWMLEEKIFFVVFLSSSTFSRPSLKGFATKSITEFDACDSCKQSKGNLLYNHNNINP